MISVESGFIDNYMEAVTGSFNALLPVLTATIGIFIAFAIANMLRFFIQKTATRLR